MKCLLPVLVLFCLLVLEVESCCKNHQVGSCCGNGPCNIFCCNCDGGCNRQCETDFGSYISAVGSAASVVGTAALFGRKKREVDETAAYFAQVDADSDGLISLGEASSFLGEHLVVRRDVGRETPEWFSKIDVDRNGFISPSEFDSKLA